MPYIRREDRPKYDAGIDRLPETIETKGDLEYCLMRVAMRYLSTRLRTFTNLHDAAYALEHVGHEIRRRFLDVREEEARADNGDVL
jgi:hypothetical protein